MCEILQTAFSNAFSKKIVVFCFKIDFRLPGVSINKESALFQVMARHETDQKALPEPMAQFIDIYMRHQAVKNQSL